MTGRELYEQCRKERFNSAWWVTTRPEEVDSPLTQGIRRRALSEALEDHDELKEAI
jgi:hypothetical protein